MEEDSSATKGCTITDLISKESLQLNTKLDEILSIVKKKSVEQSYNDSPNRAKYLKVASCSWPSLDGDPVIDISSVREPIGSHQSGNSQEKRPLNFSSLFKMNI